MTNVDEAIRRALSTADIKAYETLGRELSPYQEALAAFQSQHRALAITAWAGGVLLFVGFVYASWRFVQSADTRTMLIWFGIAAAAFLSLGLVKLWFWLEMQKNSVVREVKRLKLQVAALIAASSKPPGG